MSFAQDHFTVVNTVSKTKFQKRGAIETCVIQYFPRIPKENVQPIHQEWT